MSSTKGLRMQAKHDNLVERCVRCTACRLRLSRRNAVVYRGTFPSVLMILGEDPSEEDDRQGRPLAGDFFDRLMEQAGIPPDAPYVTNLVKCYPCGRKPTTNEIQACHSFLREQMVLVKPRCVVTLGEEVIKAVTKATGSFETLLLTDWVCAWDETIRVIPAYNPNQLKLWLGNRTEWEKVRDTVVRLNRAWDLARG